jgi:hypothetical protein
MPFQNRVMKQLLARSLSGIAISGERFYLVRELADSLSSGFFRLSGQVVGERGSRRGFSAAF